MKRARRAIIAGAGLLVVVLAGCPAGGPSAREKGAMEAAAALAAGTLELREFPPLPSPASHGEYITLLRERCGVAYSVPSLPPGVAHADFIQEVRGWNETMEAEIRRKFGADILGPLREEAGKRWQAKIDAGKKR